jgi:hypothetical protein
MSLQKWLGKGKRVSIGGKEFLVMPLPLKTLYDVWDWLEQNCKDTIQEVLEEMKTSTTAPNALELIGRVLRRVNLVDVAHHVLTITKNPETGKPLNEVSKEFLMEYLDLPSSKEFAVVFVEVNQLEDMIKNLQRLPIAQKVMDLVQTTLGLPFLNLLQQNMDSLQQKSGSSPSNKSDSISGAGTTAEPESPLTTKKPSETQGEQNPKEPLVM